MLPAHERASLKLIRNNIGRFKVAFHFRNGVDLVRRGLTRRKSSRALELVPPDAELLSSRRRPNHSLAFLYSRVLEQVALHDERIDAFRRNAPCSFRQYGTGFTTTIPRAPWKRWATRPCLPRV